MKLKKAAALFLATIMVTSLVAGCGSSKDGNSNDTDNTNVSNEGDDVKSSGTITVDFWTAPQIVQYNFWDQKATEFNNTNTVVNGKTVKIKVQQMPESPSSEAGIQNAIATGTVPAISENINRGFAATLAASDVVYDLQDEEWFKDVIEARVMESSIEGWAINGKQYVIPVYVNPMIWQWNMIALNELGIDKAPETIAEFKEAIQAFVDNPDKMSAIGVTHTFYRPSLTRSDQWWDRWYDFQMPYEALSGGKAWVDGDELVLDEEYAIQAFELIGQFGNTIQKGELSSIWTEEHPSVLVTINAPWEIDLMRENNKVYGTDYVYGQAIVNNAGDTPYNFADSKGLVLYKHSSISDDEHAGAVAFTKWVYNKENSAQTDLEWLDATTMLPVRGDLNENETFKAKMEEYPELAALAEAVPYSIPSIASENATDIMMALTESGTGPYITEAMTREPLDAPDATSYVEAAMEAMREAGNLK